MELIDIFKALGDENRLRIFNLLSRQKLCVCELEVLLQIKQSNLSRHLNKLKTEKIIISEKVSQWVYYSIDERFMNEKRAFYDWVLLEIKGQNKHSEDVKRLNRYKANNFNCNEIKNNLDKVLQKLGKDRDFEMLF
ncbi:metalloregulator ArsR/SmtB family transcription factor [Wukongibacter baidiensis]|uniref:ArsR/SmtB family transcription factor n=1 Tax=Wukongibacter baidiensis TaxID=1723361 RepID=UPI003D7FCBCF